MIVVGKEEIKTDSFGTENLGISGKKKIFTLGEYPSKFTVKGQNAV